MWIVPKKTKTIATLSADQKVNFVLICGAFMIVRIIPIRFKNPFEFEVYFNEL